LGLQDWATPSAGDWRVWNNGGLGVMGCGTLDGRVDQDWNKIWNLKINN